MNKQKLLIAFFIILHTNMLHSMEQADSSNYVVIDKTKLPRVEILSVTGLYDDTEYIINIRRPSFLLLLMEAFTQAKGESNPQFYELLQKIKQRKIEIAGLFDQKIPIGQAIEMGTADKVRFVRITPKDFYHRLLTNIYRLGNTFHAGTAARTPILIKNNFAYLDVVVTRTEDPQGVLQSTCCVHGFSNTVESQFDKYEREAEVKKILDDYSALSDKRP